VLTRRVHAQRRLLVRLDLDALDIIKRSLSVPQRVQFDLAASSRADLQPRRRLLCTFHDGHRSSPRHGWQLLAQRRFRNFSRLINWIERRVQLTPHILRPPVDLAEDVCASRFEELESVNVALHKLLADVDAVAGLWWVLQERLCVQYRLLQIRRDFVLIHPIETLQDLRLHNLVYVLTVT
jgi:hypothetical protein